MPRGKKQEEPVDPEQKQREEEAKAEAEKAEKERKKKALTDYQRHLKSVKDLKEMTDTSAWQAHYAEIQDSITMHGKQVLEVEKTREVVRHQEGVKILRGMVTKVRAPVDALNEYVNAYPLFLSEMPMRAEWNSALGKVELRKA